MRLAAFFFMFALLCSAPAVAQEGNDFNLAEALGAKLVGADMICIFIPSLDQEGNTINQFQWVNRTLAILTELCGGATAVPPSIGWGKLAHDKPPQESETTVVYAFFNREQFDDEKVKRLSAFLWDMLKDVNLEHLYLGYNGKFYTFSAQP